MWYTTKNKTGIFEKFFRKKICGIPQKIKRAFLKNFSGKKLINIQKCPYSLISPFLKISLIL